MKEFIDALKAMKEMADELHDRLDDWMYDHGEEHERYEEIHYLEGCAYALVGEIDEVLREAKKLDIDLSE